jgi:hypothetical protein
VRTHDIAVRVTLDTKQFRRELRRTRRALWRVRWRRMPALLLRVWDSPWLWLVWMVALVIGAIRHGGWIAVVGVAGSAIVFGARCERRRGAQGGGGA